MSSKVEDEKFRRSSERKTLAGVLAATAAMLLAVTLSPRREYTVFKTSSPSNDGLPSAPVNPSSGKTTNQLTSGMDLLTQSVWIAPSDLSGDTLEVARTKLHFQSSDPGPLKAEKIGVDGSDLDTSALMKTAPFLKFMNDAVEYQINKDKSLSKEQRLDKKTELLRELKDNPEKSESILEEYANSSQEARRKYKKALQYAEQQGKTK